MKNNNEIDFSNWTWYKAARFDEIQTGNQKIDCDVPRCGKQATRFDQSAQRCQDHNVQDVKDYLKKKYGGYDD